MLGAMASLQVSVLATPEARVGLTSDVICPDECRSTPCPLRPPLDFDRIAPHCLLRHESHQADLASRAPCIFGSQSTIIILFNISVQDYIYINQRFTCNRVGFYDKFYLLLYIFIINVAFHNVSATILKYPLHDNINRKFVTDLLLFTLKIIKLKQTFTFELLPFV